MVKFKGLKSSISLNPMVSICHVSISEGPYILTTVEHTWALYDLIIFPTHISEMKFWNI